VVIPAVDDVANSTATPDDGKVHINTATATEMEELPGVGPVLAKRILAFREENGLFTTVEDLLDVPGIGEAKLEALRDSVALP
jgi:competence protein ComEA